MSRTPASPLDPTSAAQFRAFVAGATGYTGREVVRVLREQGIPTVAHVRSDSPSLERARAGFALIGAETDSTPWTPVALHATLTRLQPTHVFALLGITQKRAKQRAAAGAPPESYESVDYGLTAMLLEATRRATPSAKFVYLSALGATERTGNEYVRVRGRVEREIREAGLSALIVRPSFITGPDREEGSSHRTCGRVGRGSSSPDRRHARGTRPSPALSGPNGR